MTYGSNILSRDQLLEQALSLPVDDRAFIADMLLGSLPERPLPSEKWAAEWSQEIDRRVAAYDRGEVKAISFEESIERVRRALEAHRSSSPQ